MKAIAPGKIILSGEHAVVHGTPAIALAVQRYASVDTTHCDDAVLQVQTPFGGARLASLDDAGAVDARMQARYQAFLAGDLPIAEVMPDKKQFVELGWLLLRRRMPGQVKGGVSIAATSDLPLGSGMGSSAAIAAALFTSLAAHYNLELDSDTCFELALELEQFQHGHPSGVDPYLATHGGAICYRRDGEPETVRLPAQELCIINTGQPESTTGECVAQVRKTHGASDIWSAFEDVCKRMRSAQEGSCQEDLIAAIRDNHRLLVGIGVVPESIQQLVSSIEAKGGAAKICGAGSIRGDAAGVVWVVGKEARAELKGSLIALEGDPHGARIVG